MKKAQIRKYAFGAVAAGALAAAGVFVLPSGSAGWAPVTYGLTTSPERIVPATVSEDAPARVVTTTIDAGGRPVVTVKEATDKASAIKLVEDAQNTENAVGVEMDAKVYAIGVPAGSDPSRAQQWSLDKIRTTEAWQRSTGAGVKVAVIDSGVDATHPDLRGNVLSGYDAITDRAGTTTDRHGHGTHVAGTVAAVTGNNIGVTAVAPDVKILPVKVLSDDGSGNMSDTAEGIIWAADNGAQVINMSLGSTSKVGAVSNAISYARSKGVTVIAAVGNDRENGSPTSYPAADAGVIGVAATDSADRIGHYSTAGSYVDVAAPGTNILSTYPGGQYKTMMGTSMATPHVAAVAALLKSYQPSLSPDQIETALEKSAVDLGRPGFDNDFGNGRIDAVAALNAVTPATTAPSTPPSRTPTTAPSTSPVTTPPSSAPVTTPPSSAPATTPPSSAPATPPAAGAPVTTPPATPPAVPGTKVKPVITAGTAGGEATYGTNVGTTFTVTAGEQAWAGKPVQVCVAEGDAASSCITTMTSDLGTVQVDRTAKAHFRVVVTVTATPESETATSAPVAYRVRATATLAKGGFGQIQATLIGANGRATQIQQSVNGQWRTIGAYPVRVSPMKVTLTGLRPGQTYRLVVPDGTTVLGATSAPIVA